LKRELTLLDTFCIATGAMISSGLFVLPGIAYAAAGPAVVLAFLLAGILVIPALLSKAELSTAMPKAGGAYFFIERSLGGAFGTIGGMASWLSLTLKSAFALVGMGSFAVLLFPDISAWQVKAIASGLCLVFVVINFVGARHAGRFQSVLVIGLLAATGYFIVRGLPAVSVENFAPFMPHGTTSLFATAGLVFVSYGGLTKITGVAEEVKNPGRNVPRAMFLSFTVVTIVYVLAVFTTVGTLPASLLSGSRTPLSLAASAFSGPVGLIIMTIAALIAFTTTGNAGILSASRTPMAMSRDGLLPGVFARVNSRHGTPHVAILATGAFMIALIVLLDLETLIKTASTMKIVLFLLVNVAVIMMRESKMQGYRPTFRSPLYPWIQIFAIVVYGFLVFEMGTLPLVITAVFFAGSLLWYVAYVGLHGRRDSALIQVVRRITSRELATSSLDAELREILKERDEIEEDRFDRLVKTCTVMDMDHGEPVDAFFKRLSKVLGHELKMEPDEVLDLLVKREAESTTALRPGLAIPHIVVEGKGLFSILLARSRGGIVFSDDVPPVHAVFVLIGSRDERNYHLRALMHVAQITQHSDFDRRWKAARGPEDLRNIVLLGERRRDAGAA
jgi:amino acid transporter/mannitol/fructose-specific phosphotransferase system IIA component (Ntr-type)